MPWCVWTGRPSKAKAVESGFLRRLTVEETGFLIVVFVRHYVLNGFAGIMQLAMHAKVEVYP